MNIYRSKWALLGAKHDIKKLLKATAHAADDTVLGARKRLSSALSKTGAACELGAGNAGRFVKGHAGETAAVALLTGVVAGYFLFRNGFARNHSE